MQHINPLNIKTCLLLDTHDFIIDCQNALRDNNIIFEGCIEGNGFILFSQNEEIQKILDNNQMLYKKLADYYNIDRITSIHCDNMDHPLFWICFKDK